MNADDLRAAIEAAPDDPAGYAVYGDWLSERGDPLGEIVAAQHALMSAKDARQRELAVRLGELTTAYEAEHFSEFFARRSWAATWRFGFLDRLELSHYLGAEVVKAVATTPAARFLRELSVNIRPDERRSSWVDPEDTTDPFPALAEHGLPQSLRTLDIGVDLWSFDTHHPVDFSPLYPHIQNVEQLTLEEPDILGVLTLPKLRDLRVDSFDDANIEDLARAKLPALQSIRFSYGPWKALERLALPGAPQCQTLSLYGGLQTDHTIFDALPRMPLLPHLHTLDLSWVADSETVTSLIPIAPSLMHLEAIKVNAASLSPIVEAGLTHVLGSRLVKV